MCLISEFEALICEMLSRGSKEYMRYVHGCRSEGSARNVPDCEIEGAKARNVWSRIPKHRCLKGLTVSEDYAHEPWSRSPSHRCSECLPATVRHPETEGSATLLRCMQSARFDTCDYGGRDVNS